MSNALPKEKQSAYQRWELASFDPAEPAPTGLSENPESAKELSENLIATQEKAREDGYSVGLAEGRKAGIEEGRKTGLKEGRAQAEKEVQTLRNLVLSFQAEIGKADELIAQDILDLTLDIAKSMLHSALRVQPEIILPIISEAVRYLPSVQQPAKLLLNPADAPVVIQHMGDELVKAGWRISEDAHIERGGCRVETASNQIDATPSTRWQRINSALGKDTDWLAS